MAAIVNDRNELFSGAIQRLDSAEVYITSSVGNLSIASGATSTTPSSATLTANASAYTSPTYAWYKQIVGVDGAFVLIGGATSNTYNITGDAAFITAMGASTLIRYKVVVTQSPTYNSSEAIFDLPVVRSGSSGVSPTIYWLSTSADVIQQNIAKVYTPTTLTVSGYTATGGTTAAYAGRFKIYENGSGTASYTSAIDESSKVYTPSNNAVTQIKVELYTAGGVITLLDSEIIPIVVDGSGAMTVNIANDNNVYPAPVSGYAGISFGSALSVVTAYIGSQQLTYGASGANTFSCTITTTSGITMGTSVGAGSGFEIQPPTAMSVNFVSVPVVVTLRNASGAVHGVITQTITYSLARKGDTGAGAVVEISGGVRTFTYDSGGLNPNPAPTAFTAKLYIDGVEIPTGSLTYSWVVTGLFTGTGTASTFTPTLNATHSSVDTTVKVSITYSAKVYTETIPIICNKIGARGSVTTTLQNSAIFPYPGRYEGRAKWANTGTFPVEANATAVDTIATNAILGALGLTQNGNTANLRFGDTVKVAQIAGSPSITSIWPGGIGTVSNVCYGPDNRAWYLFTNVDSSTGLTTGQGRSIYVSTDNGSTWSFLLTQPYIVHTVINIGSAIYICCNDGHIYRVDSQGNTLAYIGATTTITGIAIGGPSNGTQRYVVSASNGKLYHSTDFITWTAISLNGANTWPATDILFAGGIFVTNTVNQVGGGDNKFWYSYDGLTWVGSTVFNYTTVPSVVKMAYGKGVWLAVTVWDQLLTSTNGKDWVNSGIQPISGNIQPTDIIFDQYFIVTALGGKYAYSTDMGATWTQGNTSPQTNDLLKVRSYGGTIMMAQGNTLFAKGINPVTLSMSGIWSGTKWLSDANVIDGSLIVKESIASESIDTRNLTIKDPLGNVILSAGGLNPVYIKDLSVDTIKIKNNAITVKATGSSGTITNIITTAVTSSILTTPKGLLTGTVSLARVDVTDTSPISIDATANVLVAPVGGSLNANIKYYKVLTEIWVVRGAATEILVSGYENWIAPGVLATKSMRQGFKMPSCMYTPSVANTSYEFYIKVTVTPYDIAIVAFLGVSDILVSMNADIFCVQFRK